MYWLFDIFKAKYLFQQKSVPLLSSQHVLYNRVIATYLDPNVSILNIARVQHDGTALVYTIVLGSYVLDQQAVDIFDKSVAVLDSSVLLVPIDQWRRVGLDFATHFVTGPGDRVLFGGSVHPRNIV